MKATTDQVLTQLDKVLGERKQAEASSSYVASLYEKGINKILEKVGEESAELIIAAKDLSANNTAQHRQDVINETADLWFHSMVMLAKLDMNSGDVLAQLEKRFNLSGHDEKASRTQR